MTLLHEIEWEKPLVEPRRDPEVEAAFRKKFGFVPESVAFYGRCPWVVRSYGRFDMRRDGLVHVDFDLAEVIGLVVSQDNSCRFCYAASRALLRFQGYSDERIRRLEENLAAALSPSDQVAVDFARRVSRANPIPSSADRRPLQDAGYSAEGIKELAFLASLHVYYNRLATLLAVPTESIEQLGKSGVLKWARPLVGWYVRRRRRRGRPTRVPQERRAGPFAHAVLALDGLPVALALRDVIDDAWGSRLLPVRTKALVFAVIARGLGSACSEREARDVLLREGLSEKGVEDALSHLAGPELSAAESALAPLARETIWYRPAAIQRHAHRIRPQFTDEEFLEFVGIAALANAVCRLAAVADDR